MRPLDPQTGAPTGRRTRRGLGFAVATAVTLWLVGPAPAAGRVLLVGSFHGQRAFHGHRILRGGPHYRTIQRAVDAARRGDWILIAPGDYNERGDYGRRHRARDEAGAGVTITRSGVHLRGMDRNRVVVDGTRRAGRRCSARARAQDRGPRRGDGKHLGRNGIEVFKASGVTVENLTVCNFLSGAGEGGNEIWFNGGDGSGKIGLGRFKGRFLSATSTFYGGPDAPAGRYGIFASNSRGPGLIDRTYASNMNDASYYVGACPDCHTVLRHGHAENSALGYSGTNSGGHLVIERSEWDRNKTGITTNSQNNDDAPSPQNGRCPHSTRSCTVFRRNYVHDNNNPNVPTAGTAALGPPGTGIVVAGGRYDTVAHNRIVHNGAWGIIVVPYPDDTRPPLATASHCRGGRLNFVVACYYGDWGNEFSSNLLSGNGFFGNPTNGDLGDISVRHDPGNCFRGNRRPPGQGSVTSAPGDLQLTHRSCGVPNQGAGLGDPLSAQFICASEGFGPCPPSPGLSYPRVRRVRMLRLRRQRSMRNPCGGVPRNPWCPARTRRR
jgi:hypothetical protein